MGIACLSRSTSGWWNTSLNCLGELFFPLAGYCYRLAAGISAGLSARSAACPLHGVCAPNKVVAAARLPAWALQEKKKPREPNYFFSFIVFLLFEVVSHYVAQTGLKLTVQPRLTLTSWSSLVENPLQNPQCWEARHKLPWSAPVIFQELRIPIASRLLLLSVEAATKALCEYWLLFDHCDKHHHHRHLRGEKACLGWWLQSRDSRQRAAGRVAGASGSRHSGWSSQQKAHILNCSYDIQASHVISIRS